MYLSQNVASRNFSEMSTCIYHYGYGVDARPTQFPAELASRLNSEAAKLSMTFWRLLCRFGQTFYFPFFSISVPDFPLIFEFYVFHFFLS